MPDEQPDWFMRFFEATFRMVALVIMLAAWVAIAFSVGWLVVKLVGEMAP